MKAAPDWLVGCEWPPRCSWPVNADQTADDEGLAFEIARSIESAFQSGQWGAYNSDIQQTVINEIRQSWGVGHVRLMPSGSAAVEWGLRAAGVQAGDVVVMAALDYPGNLRAIELVGGRPMLMDIAADRPSVSPAELRRLDLSWDRKITAVIASHLFGMAAEIDSLRLICENRGWTLIEDACQVPGMMIGDRMAGSIGHLGTLSFGGSKPLTAGSGGAILTNSDRITARLAASLDRPSDAMPMSPLQSAAVLPQLKYLRSSVNRRNEIAAAIRNQFDTWQVPVGSKPSFYKIAFKFPNTGDRDQAITRAIALGLPMGLPFRSLHCVSVRRAERPFELPRSEHFAATTAVLDHRVLQVNPSHLPQLLSALRDCGVVPTTVGGDQSGVSR